MSRRRDCRTKRECFWLEQLEGYKDRNVLFVCGHKHFDSFAAKSTAAGFKVQCGRRTRHIRHKDFEQGA
jgi:hypothetical protein